MTARTLGHAQGARMWGGRAAALTVGGMLALAFVQTLCAGSSTSSSLLSVFAPRAPLGGHRSGHRAKAILSLRGGGEESASRAQEYNSKDAEKYDRVLWDMLTQHPDEIHFLNTVFNFLQRRTPCFNGPNAERNYQILIDTLSKQKQGYLDHVAKGKAMRKPEPMPPKPPKTATAPVAEKNGKRPPASVEEQMEEEARRHNGALEIDGYIGQSDDAARSAGPEAHKAAVNVDHCEEQDNGEEQGHGHHHEGSQDIVKGGGGGQEVLQVPVNNGGRTNQYVWSQTLNDVTLEVFLPKNTPTKSIVVDMTVTHLSVTIKNGPDTVTVLQGEFEESTKPDEGTWTREGDVLVITVAKHGDMSWWACAFRGHAKIDVQKIEPQNSNLHELDPDMRQTVEKMMYDQKLKAQGKPTLDEAKKKEQMQKFMDMHPEMDFSQCKFG